MTTLQCKWTFNQFTGTNPYLEEDFGQISSAPEVYLDYKDPNGLDPSNTACGGAETQDKAQFSSTVFTFDVDTETHDQAFQIQTEDYGRITETSDLIPGSGIIPPYPPAAGGPKIAGGMSEETTRYVPHWGIESNIGIGTTGIQISGEVKFYLPIYPRSSRVPGSGQGTIVLASGAVESYSEFGDTNTIPFIFTGIGFESFSPVGFQGSGSLFTIGDADTSYFNVYTYEADSSQPIVIDSDFSIVPIVTLSVNGEGGFIVSGETTPLRTFGYSGSGTVNAVSGAAESTTIQTELLTNTALFDISGNALESFTVDDPIDTVLYQYGGQLEESVTKSVVGVPDPITLNGEARVTFNVVVPTDGVFVVESYFVDDDRHKTCDNDDLTVDREDNGLVAFAPQIPETTVLYQIFGDAFTATDAEYVDSGIGTISIVGSSSIRKTNATKSDGILLSLSAGGVAIGPQYVGVGSLFTLSGSSESFAAKNSETTLILSLIGDAITKVSSSFVGIGSYNITGSSTSRTTRFESGSGLINISGELVFPDIRFVPSGSSSGTIFILGSSRTNISPLIKASGSLFALSGGFESFTPDGYVGTGTIFTLPVTSIDSYSAFQISRTFSLIV